jgi:hypothetical protein
MIDTDSDLNLRDYGMLCAGFPDEMKIFVDLPFISHTNSMVSIHINVNL